MANPAQPTGGDQLGYVASATRSQNTKTSPSEDPLPSGTWSLNVQSTYVPGWTVIEGYREIYQNW